MAKFHFKMIETREVFSTYTVEADSEDEARIMAADGNADDMETGEATTTDCSILYRCDEHGNEISASTT